MKVLFCNPKNNQGKTHSRKGMYPPLGILSIATFVQKALQGRIVITVIDEDVDAFVPETLRDFDLVCLYATTFNYAQCVDYATQAKGYGKKTLLGGPHPSILAENIMRNQSCFDFIIRGESELPMLRLLESLLSNSGDSFYEVPNLMFRKKGKICISSHFHENNLADLPILSREYINFESYIGNFRKIYPEKNHIRPGSIYSSKGCSWRDKTGGCVFCARLEKGVRFREVDQIWEEIQLLRSLYKVNSIWDISDDNLNNREWFRNFAQKRPADCSDLSFFIYSRVNLITPEMIPYFHRLNVEEIFLGVESGDNYLLKKALKGQTKKSSLRAISLLKENNIKYFPSFVLGLPGETEESLSNTLKLCSEMAKMGGLDRLGCTILQPMPGSAAFDMIATDEFLGEKLRSADDISIENLEKYWIKHFTTVDYSTVVKFRNEINELMAGVSVFGCSQEESEKK